MRPVERYFRKQLKIGCSPERIRKVIICRGYNLFGFPGHKIVSHWPTIFKQLFCGNCSNAEQIYYCNTKKIHFTEVPCNKAKIAYCVDVETGEISKHPLLSCPDGQYQTEGPNDF